jgi:glycerophosphoryl diester phosphodiesterase
MEAKMDWHARGIGLRIGGHRGDPASAPENTFASFEAAAAAGVDFIETDIQRTADGALVLFHDDTLDRTTRGSGRVANVTSVELFALDAGSWFAPTFRNERVPSLDAFLNWIGERSGLGAEFDVKARGIAAELAERISLSAVQGRIAICSALADELREVKHRQPQIPCFLILEDRVRAPIELIEACGADGADMPWQWWDDELVDQMRLKGLGIMGSTANDRQSIEQLLTLSADFVDSDTPQSALAVRNARAGSTTMWGTL